MSSLSFAQGIPLSPSSPRLLLPPKQFCGAEEAGHIVLILDLCPLASLHSCHYSLRRPDGCVYVWNRESKIKTKCVCAHMHGRSFILRKSQARARNCILAQRSGMEGTRDGLQQQERVRDTEEGEGGIGLHNGIVCYNDKRVQQNQSRIRFLKERTVNTANTWPSYSYTQECPAAAACWQPLTLALEIDCVFDGEDRLESVSNRDYFWKKGEKRCEMKSRQMNTWQVMMMRRS